MVISILQDIKDVTKDLQLLERELGSLHIKQKDFHGKWSMSTEKKETLKSLETMIQVQCPHRIIYILPTRH